MAKDKRKRRTPRPRRPKAEEVTEEVTEEYGQEEAADERDAKIESLERRLLRRRTNICVSRRRSDNLLPKRTANEKLSIYDDDRQTQSPSCFP